MTNKKERVKEIYKLLSDAWVLAYELELESEGEEKKFFGDFGSGINRLKCETHRWNENNKY